MPNITPNARASSLSLSRRSAAASSALNAYPNPASPITSSVARASHGRTSSLHGALDRSAAAAGAARDLTMLGSVGDAFDGRKDENGFGRNYVVAAHGLSGRGSAGSGSTSPGCALGSGAASGSAGVKKDFGEAVMSSHMSRSLWSA